MAVLEPHQPGKRKRKQKNSKLNKLPQQNGSTDSIPESEGLIKPSKKKQRKGQTKQEKENDNQIGKTSSDHSPDNSEKQCISKNTMEQLVDHHFEQIGVDLSSNFTNTTKDDKQTLPEV